MEPKLYKILENFVHAENHKNKGHVKSITLKLPYLISYKLQQEMVMDNLRYPTVIFPMSTDEPYSINIMGTKVIIEPQKPHGLTDAFMEVIYDFHIYTNGF